MIDAGKVAFDVAFKAVKQWVVLMDLVVGLRDLEHAKVGTLTFATGEGVFNENIFENRFNNGDDGVVEDTVDEGGS